LFRYRLIREAADPELSTKARGRLVRTVARGGTQIIGQRVQVGLRYTGQIVPIEVDDTTLRVYDHRDHLIKTIPRTNRKEVTRHKAYGHHQPQNQLGTDTHQLNPIRHPSGSRHAHE
jgi:hypothetical protein